MRRTLAFAALLLLALFVRPVLADRATAEFFDGRGDKALDAGDAGEAETQYRRALEEDATYHPARFGLARALIASDRQALGLEELKVAIDGMRGDTDWRSDLKKAEALLDEVDAAGRELRELVDDHVAALVAFARRWAKKDPESAVRALHTALALRPGDEKASEAILGLGHSPKGPPRAIFDGRSLEGWMDMGGAWKLDGGVIVADTADDPYIARSVESFEGDYDVVMEARLITAHDGPTYFAICPAFNGESGHYSFGLLKGRFLFQEDRDDGTDREIVSRNPASAFDPAEWHRFELRFRGAEVSAFIDGEVLATDTKRPETRRAGFVGLLVQNCRYEIRRVAITLW